MHRTAYHQEDEIEVPVRAYIAPLESDKKVEHRRRQYDAISAIS
jgi:hypothetical protein